MSTYAIGDLQGCAREFQQLLSDISFGAGDRLWLLGDLINRGPDSVGVLRAVMDIQDQCSVVLGNHDLHFLAVVYGGHSPGRSDTMHQLLADRDATAYADWLCRQVLLYEDDNTDCVMAHAGIPHIWNLAAARRLAAEVHQVLRGEHGAVSTGYFFANMYGNEPDVWSEQLEGLPRVKLITNYFTRMRLIDAAGRLDFSHKGTVASAPAGWTPWYELAADRWRDRRLLFGHWAALDGVTGYDNLIALDTGCVYGRKLTAYCLETGERFEVPGYNRNA